MRTFIVKIGNNFEIHFKNKNITKIHFENKNITKKSATSKMNITVEDACYTIQICALNYINLKRCKNRAAKRIQHNWFNYKARQFQVIQSGNTLLEFVRK